MAKDKKKKSSKVKPQLLKGFRDYPPVEQIARQKMLAKVREQGLVSLTPAERRFLEEETQRRQASEKN